MLDRIDKYFKLKLGSVTEPDIYLGAKIRKVQIDEDTSAWARAHIFRLIREGGCEERIKMMSWVRFQVAQ